MRGRTAAWGEVWGIMTACVSTGNRYHGQVIWGLPPLPHGWCWATFEQNAQASSADPQGIARGALGQSWTITASRAASPHTQPSREGKGTGRTSGPSWGTLLQEQAENFLMPSLSSGGLLGFLP